MTLLSIEGRDFCAFGEFKQKLAKQGLVWFGGDNRDTKSANSNGASKTSFFKAISWGLFGETIDGHDGDAVIREGTKRAEITVNLSDDYRIFRTRRKGIPKLELFIGADAIPGSKDEIQSQIHRIVGMDFHTFRNVVLYGQQDTKRFISPATKDQDRKEVLQGILRTKIYTTAHEWTKKRLTEYNVKISALLVKIENAEARIEEYDLPALKLEEAEWVATNAEEVNTLKAKAKAGIAEAKRLAAETPDTSALDSDLLKLRKQQEAARKLQGQIRVYEADIAKLKLQAAELARDARAAINAHNATLEWLDQLDDGICPLCTTPATGAHFHEKVEQLKAESEASAKLYKEKQDAVEKCTLDWKKIQSTQQATQVTLDTFGDLEEQISDKRQEIAQAAGTKELARVALERAKELLHQAKTQAELENPHTKRLQASKDRLKALQAEIFVSRSECKLLENDRRHYEFWQRGFGPTGLPSFVLDSVMPYMTERTNHYLETLADGDITMNFTTQSELKSSKGEVRDKIGIFWECEGTQQKPLSGGQFKKCEIATTLAMMDLVATREGASLDLLLLDEALDGVDDEGHSRIIDLLQKLRTTRKSIFCVSHSQDIGEVFERALVVVKENGVARIEKAA